MTTTVLTVTDLASFSGFAGENGGTASEIILSDANDATYLIMTSTSALTCSNTFDLSSLTLSTGRLKSWYTTTRGGRDGPITTPLGVFLQSTTRPDLGQIQMQIIQGSQFPISNVPAGTVIGAPLVPPNLSQTDINALQLVHLKYAGASTQTYVCEASVTVVFAVAPTANITYPTGTPAIALSNPVVTWTHTPGSDADPGPQAYAEVKVYTSAQYGAGGFSPDTSTPTYTSGVMTTSATSKAVGPLANSTTFRAYVRTAQLVNGVAHWSAWDFEGFTTNYTPSSVNTVTPVATNASGLITVTVARNTGTGAWGSIELERTDDGGTTWVPVRGATGVATTNAFVPTWGSNSIVVNDYEAANGNTVTYRARASTNSGIVGAWVSSSSTSWTSPSSTTVWLKDPLDPTLNVELLVREFPQPARSVTQGIFSVIGSTYPVVISDVRRARVGTFVGTTRTLAAGRLFEAAIENQVKLLQFPANVLWGAKYIALADVQEMYAVSNRETGYRFWQIAYSEIDLPADETDY